MASLIPGYEYDIFISYRQKDNKGDRWVSEFVDALKTELESTFKEEISVYFDINPHDGLLETHDVDASLKDKLNCLIFIPIISRTYRDPKSFAWEHEFKVFINQLSQDKFGLKVKVPGGNVANRVLPIQIHDLNPDDRKVIETELGGSIRGIEFIYKEPGVNRPLMANEDHPDNNLNKTFYRNQINKVANAISEVIEGLRRPGSISLDDSHSGIKEKPSGKVNHKTKIIAGSLILLALVIAGYFIIPKLRKPTEQLEKSIAVLPFTNDSPSDTTTYFINGLTEEVINNLQKIKSFSKVLTRTSTEQYRGLAKPSIPKIARELDVNYIVAGSGQKYGNSYKIRMQLIEGKTGKQLWGNSYGKEIRETKDIYGIQSEIAQSIASELRATITPEEKQLINKIQTTNLSAYDFYQQGREEHTKYWIDNRNKAALQKAEDFYHKSLKYDSTFAQAYSGLAMVYWDKHYFKENEYFSKNYMDSVLILCGKSLSFDYKLSEPYTLKGRYFNEIGRPEQAIEEFDKAIKLNPNDWVAYDGKGEFYSGNDLVNSLDYYQKAASINRGRELPILLGKIGLAYFQAGFPDVTKQYYQNKLKLDGDTLAYYSAILEYEFWLANFNKSIEYGEKGYAIDSTNEGVLNYLGQNYAWLGQYRKSLKYYKNWLERLKAHGELVVNSLHRIGYVYWNCGYKEEAQYYFNEQIKYCNRMIELKRNWQGKFYTYYDLSGSYAFIGEKVKAYRNLRIFNQIQCVPFWMVMLIKTDPLFASIRNEPEFQQIVKDIESKYQTEHERARKWLEEQEKLSNK